MKIEEFADLGVAAELNNLYAVPAHRFSSAPRIQELSVTISSWISKSEGIRETFTLKAFASSRRELIGKLNSPSGLRENRHASYRISSDQAIIRRPDCVFSFQAD